MDRTTVPGSSAAAGLGSEGLSGGVPTGIQFDTNQKALIA